MKQENNSYTKKLALNTNRSTELYALKKSASCVQFTRHQTCKEKA